LLKTQDFLRDEGFRQSRIALENDSNRHGLESRAVHIPRRV
jgi:hypothetical protein